MFEERCPLGLSARFCGDGSAYLCERKGVPATKRHLTVGGLYGCQCLQDSANDSKKDDKKGTPPCPPVVDRFLPS